MKGRPPPKTPTQIKTRFVQTISGQFIQTVPLFPLKQAEKRQKNLHRLFVQTVFIWVGGFLGALMLRGCNCSAVLLLGFSHTTSLALRLTKSPD